MAVSGAAMLSGCVSNWSAQEGWYEDSEFGEANRQTFGSMVVNPAPDYVDPIETSAESASDAADRVRERNVVTTSAEDTTSAGGGGGGGG